MLVGRWWTKMGATRHVLAALVLANALTWAIVAWMLWPRAPDMYRLTPSELVCTDIAGWLLCVT